MRGDPPAGASVDAGQEPPPPNILLTLARHPRLLQPFLGFSSTLATQGELPRRESELLALRAAWNCHSPFEWGHHVLYGLDAGLSEDEVERVAAGPDAEGWTEIDRTLLCAADELHQTQNVSGATWARLQERWEPAQLIEILFVVGQYTLLSMVSNAAGVALEPHLPPMPR